LVEIPAEKLQILGELCSELGRPHLCLSSVPFTTSFSKTPSLFRLRAMDTSPDLSTSPANNLETEEPAQRRKKRVRNWTAEDRAKHRIFEKERREAFNARLNVRINHLAFNWNPLTK
jgi:hypothetical protein